MATKLELLIIRHELKENSVVVKTEEEDKKVNLSPEGAYRALGTGRRELSVSHDHILVYHTDFLRTLKTAKAILFGGGYPEMDPRISYLEHGRIGVSGIKWDHTLMPSMDLNDDDYVREILTKCYFPQEEGVVSIARYAFDMLDTVICAIETEIGMNNRNPLALICTHCPNIDAFGNVVNGALVVWESRDRGVCLEGYSGAFKMGEFIKGRIVGGTPEDPSISLSVKGKAHAHSLSDLKRMRDSHYKRVQRRV